MAANVIYSVRPYYDANVKVPLPDVMYKSKSVHSTTPFQKEGNQSLKLNWLEERQIAILKRLEELRQELKELNASGGFAQDVPFSNSQMTVCSQNFTETTIPEFQDVVICTDPSSPPPLSLFVLFELLRDNLRIATVVHVHSSVKDSVESFWKTLVNTSQQQRSNFDLVITLILKKVDQGPVLMVCPYKQTPICGEANVARFLARLIKPPYDSKDVGRATQIDEWLDVASFQILQGSNEDRAGVLKSMNTHLIKYNWLVGTSLSLADIFMWSAIQQIKQSINVPLNVKKWLESCSATTTFNLAAGFLK